jgi:hypothetical protein
MAIARAPCTHRSRQVASRIVPASYPQRPFTL